MRLEIMLDNGATEPPINSENIKIVIDNTPRGPNSRGEVRITGLSFAAKDSKVINNDKRRALDGTRSIYEGTPYNIALISGSKRLILFNGYIDKTSNQTIFSCENVRAELKESGSKQWLEDIEGSFSFEKLFVKKLITKSDFIYMPKTVSSIPDEDKIVIITIAEVSVGFELRRAFKDGADLLAELAGFFTTLPAIVKLALFAIYIGIMIFVVINLFKILLNAIIQPTKYEACMTIKKLAEVGAEFLGMKFESTKFDDEFWENTVIMPEKSGGLGSQFNLSSPIESFLKGALKPFNPEQRGYFNGTYEEYLFELLKLWNGKKIVKDGIIRIERRDFDDSSPRFKLPDIEVKDGTTNAGQIIAKRIIRFATDTQELNTIDQLKGTIANIEIEINAIENPLNIRLPGNERNSINLALGKAKKTFTGPEIFMIKAFRIIGPLVNALGLSIPDIAGSIENRLGMLLTSGDSTGVAKIFAITRGSSPSTNKIHPDNEARLSGKGVYLESYQIESFVTSPSNPNANQYEFAKIPPFNMCLEDIENVLNNPRIFKSNGDEAELETTTIVAESGLVEEMTIKENIAFDNMLLETINEPTGL